MPVDDKKQLADGSRDQPGFSGNLASSLSSVDQNGEEDDNANSEINRVNVKVPAFWCADPALWFCQLESQFETCKIKLDKTKYHTVVAAIESKVLAQVSDIVKDPPANRPYEALKKRLLERYQESDELRLKKLLRDLELGDKRPSQLLHEMRNLSVNVNLDLMRSLWLQRLPPHAQAILSISSESLDKLAVMADKICDTIAPGVSAIAMSTSSESSLSLEDKIEQLAKQISELKSFGSRGRSNSRARNSSSYVSRSRSKSEKRTLCWYHDNFKEKASKCRKPCSYKEKKSEN